MIRPNLALVILALTIAPAYGQEGTRNANYSIDVRLDTSKRTLTAHQVLTWTNIGSASVSDLRFHLYYNAWRNNESSWMREAKRSEWWPSTENRPASDFGSIDITSLQLVEGNVSRDLTNGITFIAPDDGNTADRTVASVALPAPVAPGQTIVVQMEWTSRIPHPFARTGTLGNYYFFGQWFPKIGVVDALGQWNCHQFHVLTEFFADYGTYDVHMTVPRGWPLGATGLEADKRDNADGTTTYHYRQEDVHDFAWTTSPDFVERREKFEHAGLPAVDLRLLLLPDHVGYAERHFVAARAVLRQYGEWFGPYPYGHLTMIDPGWQTQTDGMEYPTLFTVGFQWLSPREDTYLEDSVVHEAGHQWWYGVVGTNEFEDAWMDEGINQYANARVDAEDLSYAREVKRFFGGFVPWVMTDVVWDRAIDGESIFSYRREPITDTQATPSYRWWPRSPGSLAYAKPALWLHTLERALGWNVVRQILATFYERWQFRHPRPGDFFRVANEVSGRDLSPFFDQVYRGSVVFDYGVENVTVTRAGDDSFLSEIIVRRYGDGIFPVTVLLTLEDGSTRRDSWDGAGRWTRFSIEGRSRVVSAQVDPDQILLLDVNFTNNSFAVSPHTSRASMKWALKWMVWLQDQLLTWASLA